MDDDEERGASTMELVVWIMLCQLVTVFMAYDGGATPACIDSIAKTPGMTWTAAELGLLGSLDKFGITMSSVFWGRALQLAPPKYLLIVGLAINLSSTYVYGNVPIKMVMFAAKVMMGITQALFCIWGTCWVLSHAPASSRTCWLGAGAFAAGIGNGIGTGIAGFTTAAGMSYSVTYKVQSGVLFLLWLFLVLGTSSQDVEFADPEDAAEALSKEPRGSRGRPVSLDCSAWSGSFRSMSQELCGSSLVHCP
jgi:MFS family permease